MERRCRTARQRVHDPRSHRRTGPSQPDVRGPARRRGRRMGESMDLLLLILIIVVVLALLGFFGRSYW